MLQVRTSILDAYALRSSDDGAIRFAQLHSGDVNAATMALLENPFQKVDSASHKKPVSKQPAATMGGGDRTRRDGDRSGGGGGGGRRGDRDGQRGIGAGRGPTTTSGRGSSSTFTARPATVRSVPPGTKPDYARTADQQYDTYDVGYDVGSVIATASAGAPWGDATAASSSAASAPKPAAWGSTGKKLSDIIKAKQVVIPPPVPVASPPPQVAYPPISKPVSAAITAAATAHHDAEVHYEPQHLNGNATADVSSSLLHGGEATVGPKQNWSNAELAKNLLSTIKVGSMLPCMHSQSRCIASGICCLEGCARPCMRRLSGSPGGMGEKGVHRLFRLILPVGLYPSLFPSNSSTYIPRFRGRAQRLSPPPRHRLRQQQQSLHPRLPMPWFSPRRPGP